MKVRNDMGVYIKGMKMPENCMECDIRAEDDDGQYCPFTKVTALNIGRQANCPLVEIPEPHGRLIDAEVLCERLMANWLTADESGKKIISEVLTDVVTPIVVGTPTVIEAECK